METLMHITTCHGNAYNAYKCKCLYDNTDVNGNNFLKYMDIMIIKKYPINRNSLT
jgi:hypothetical protein